jgi:hypothetical protein
MTGTTHTAKADGLALGASSADYLLATESATGAAPDRDWVKNTARRDAIPSAFMTPKPR